MLTQGEFFAGIGGFAQGGDRVGIKTLWQVEIDPICLSVLERHYPETRKFTDIRKVSFRHGKGWYRYEHPEPVDIFVGGFPCQDISVAGKRRGLSGERSGLWWELHRCISEARPTWVVVENVPGLLSSNGGKDMGAILWSLAELGYGYAYRVLDSRYFGVPRKRRRVFIIAHRSDWAAPGKILFEPECVHGNPRKSRKAGEESTWVSGTLLASGVGTAKVGQNKNELDFLLPEVSHCLTTKEGQRFDPSLETLFSEQGRVRRLLPVECERLQGFPDNYTEWGIVAGRRVNISDAARYRMTGNAATTNVVEWISRRIVAYGRER